MFLPGQRTMMRKRIWLPIGRLHEATQEGELKGKNWAPTQTHTNKLWYPNTSVRNTNIRVYTPQWTAQSGGGESACVDRPYYTWRHNKRVPDQATLLSGIKTPHSCLTCLLIALDAAHITCRVMGVKVICCKITDDCRVLYFSTCPIWCSAPNPEVSAPGWNGQVVKCKCSATIYFCDHLPPPLTVVSIVFFLYLGFSLWCQVTCADGMVIWRQHKPPHCAIVHPAPVPRCVPKDFYKVQSWVTYTLISAVSISLCITRYRGKFPKQFCIFLYMIPSILLTH